MLFPTAEFAIFFAAVLAGPIIVGTRKIPHQMFLLAASYVFYAAWDWRFLALLVGSGILNWFIGTLVYRVPVSSADTTSASIDVATSGDRINTNVTDVTDVAGRSGIGAILLARLNAQVGSVWQRVPEWICASHRRRKLTLILGICANFVTLGFFKYYDFFVENLSEMLFSIGFGRDMVFLDVLAPVGISFFTFQGVSFLIDSYKGEIAKKPTALEVLLFISFFPQLVAGPLLRASQFLPQIQAKPIQLIEVRAVCTGLILIVVGLFKKMFVAQVLAEEIVDPVFFDPSAVGSFDMLIAVYAYAVQIYCDFSGYTDIATGVAALLGYRFARNFNLPYRASSLREFWRRWHISLSTWLRDYLYIPLGGGKRGTWRVVRNVMITMILGGLWHGAAWQFVAWGALHGCLLALEHVLATVGRIRQKNRILLPGHLERFSEGAFAIFLRCLRGIQLFARTALLRIYVFHVVCLGWILFRATSFTSATDAMSNILRFEQNNWPEYANPGVVFLVAMSLLVHHVLPDNPPDGPVTEKIEDIPRRADMWQSLGRTLSRAPLWAIGILFGTATGLVVVMARPGVTPFIYFQF